MFRRGRRVTRGHADGAVEGGLDGVEGDGSLLRGDVGGPGEEDARPGFGDEEAVPGAELPGAQGEGVEGADAGGLDELGELGGTGLGDHGGAARAVGGHGADVAGGVGVREVAETGGAGAGGRAADGEEAEPLHGAGDEFAVEGLADEDGDALVAEAVGAGEERAVPEDEDGRAGDLVAGDCAGIGHLLVMEGGAEEADEGGRERWDESEGESLEAGVGRHGFECTSGLAAGVGPGRGSGKSASTFAGVGVYVSQTFF